MLGGEQDCYAGCTDAGQGYYGLIDEVYPLSVEPPRGLYHFPCNIITAQPFAPYKFLVQTQALRATSLPGCLHELRSL